MLDFHYLYNYKMAYSRGLPCNRYKLAGAGKTVRREDELSTYFIRVMLSLLACLIIACCGATFLKGNLIIY